MQIKSQGYGIKGWYRVKRYAARMQTVSATALRRVKILDFWQRHGLSAAIDAFGVSRRTLYYWQRTYRAAQGKAHALNEGSRAPRRCRSKRPWDVGVFERLVQLRTDMPAIGFEKLRIFLLDWCEARSLHCPSVSTIRRRARQDVRLRSVRKRPPASQRLKSQGQRRPKGYVPKAPGECVGVDTIEIHGSGLYRGMRRYVMTFKDMHSRFALAAAVPSKHASNATRKVCYPFKPQRVLSDNGSEFKAGFTQTVLNDGAVRWLTYPKCPKMNAHAERFNRTIQEEFIEFHKDLLFDDIDAFNDKLLDYLIWFNEERPHYALNLRSPMQFLKQQHQCNMYWRNTRH